MSTEDNGQLLDTRAGIENVGGNESLYRRVMAEFHRDQRADVDKIRLALINGQLHEAHVVAHTLKGLAATIGAMNLSQCAFKVDEPLKQGNMPDPKSIDDLDAALQSVLHEVSQLPEVEATAARSSPMSIEESLAELSTMIDERNPEIEYKMEEVHHQLVREFDVNLVQQLEDEIMNFDFESASKTFRRLRQRD